MIDPFAHDLLTLRDAAKLFPARRGGSRIAISTLWRWASRGCGGVRLEIARVGGVTYTTREAIAEFVSARSISGVLPKIAVPSSSSPGVPTARSRRAVAQLEAMNPSSRAALSSPDGRPSR